MTLESRRRDDWASVLSAVALVVMSVVERAPTEVASATDPVSAVEVTAVPDAALLAEAASVEVDEDAVSEVDADVVSVEEDADADSVEEDADADSVEEDADVESVDPDAESLELEDDSDEPEEDDDDELEEDDDDELEDELVAPVAARRVSKSVWVVHVVRVPELGLSKGIAAHMVPAAQDCKTKEPLTHWENLPLTHASSPSVHGEDVVRDWYCVFRAIAA